MVDKAVWANIAVTIDAEPVYMREEPEMTLSDATMLVKVMLSGNRKVYICQLVV
jgi:hypothetical protein